MQGRETGRRKGKRRGERGGCEGFLVTVIFQFRFEGWVIVTKG